MFVATEIVRKCSKCGSTNITIEGKRIRTTECLDCGFITINKTKKIEVDNTILCD